MSIVLDTLSDWRDLEGPIGLRGANDTPRKVKIYFNAEVATPLFIKEGSVSPRFLTTIPAGLSQVLFSASGDLEISPEPDFGGYVQWQSTETEEFVFEGSGESFTTIHERPPRNEAFEYIQFVAQQNQKRFEAEMAARMEAQIDAIRSDYDARLGVHGGPPAEHQEPERQPVAADPKAVQPGEPQGQLHAAVAKAGAAGPAAREQAEGNSPK